MMKLMLCVTVIATMALAQEAADLMPSDGEIPGWVKDGDPQTAQTPEELYGLIDGAAVVYLAYGFVECVFQDYAGLIAGQPTDLDAQVFDQGSPENAHQVYIATAIGLETEWSGVGDEARITYMLPFNFTLDFRRNRFFVRLNIGREADSLQALQTIQAFAYAMDEVAVPVELTRFTAVRNGSSCVLSWTTATETDCFGFLVRRSISGDASTASVISPEVLPGAGTSCTPRNYRFVDHAAPPGTLWYWLEEHSLDGTTRLLGPARSVGSETSCSWGRIKASF